MLIYTDPQGSEAWLESRRGVITGSRFKDCRDRLKSGAPSKKCQSYLNDVVRERCRGLVPSKFQTQAMRTGSEQEAFARMAYEAKTGVIVEESGFITTDDRMYGVSVDGLVEDDGLIEIKTMVSSDTLMDALVGGDISEYIDQCNGEMWLLGRKWTDLILWAPDMEHLGLHYKVIRIERDEDKIQKLEDDLVWFGNEAKKGVFNLVGMARTNAKSLSTEKAKEIEQICEEIIAGLA